MGFAQVGDKGSECIMVLQSLYWKEFLLREFKNFFEGSGIQNNTFAKAGPPNASSVDHCLAAGMPRI